MKFFPRRAMFPVLILWLAFGLRLYQLDFQSIWWDEGHSIFIASQPISQIPTLPAMDVHPPAYFSLLHLWLALAGHNEFTLRFLSVVFSLLTVALLWRFASSPRLIASPFFASLLAALSPLYIAYAQEVRSYAMITFLALASTFTLWRILFTGPRPPTPDPRLIVTYIILTAACLYTHYFTIFLLVFHNLAWLIWTFTDHKKRTSRFFTWIVSQVGILLLFAPQLLLALRQITSYTNPNLTPPRLSDFILRTWQAYTTGLTLDPQPATWSMTAIALIFGLILFFQLFKNLTQPSNSSTSLRTSLPTSKPPNPQTSKPPNLQTLLFLLGWFLIPLTAYFLVLQRQPSFEPRYLLLVTPALFLILGSGVRGQGSDITFYASRITHHASRFILLAILLFALHSYYTNETYFKDDSAGVADWLAAETTANDLVYVDVPHPLHYYADRRHLAAPPRYLFVDIHTAADILTREAAGRACLFWITWRGSDTDPRGVIPFLAQKYGQRLGQRDFRGYHVEWFSLPQAGAIFSLPTDLPPVSATFGDVLRLDGAALGGYPPGGESTPTTHPAWATLHFTLLRDTDVDYKVSLRLRGEEGRIAAQIDKDLLNDRHFRTSAWPLADPALNGAINVYTLELAADTPPGSYRLEVVVYNAQPPYPSEGVSGLASEEGAAAVLGHITVIP